MNRSRVKGVIRLYVVVSMVVLSFESRLQGEGDKEGARSVGIDVNIPLRHRHPRADPPKPSFSNNNIIPSNATNVQIAPTSLTSKSSTELNNQTARPTASPKQKPVGAHFAPPLDLAALLRGFYVFLGLTVLLMAYFVFRSFRLSKTHAQMIRKYGILAHRQDVEMRPLPLEEEDDEDTTVFDATNISMANNQHQSL